MINYIIYIAKRGHLQSYTRKPKLTTKALAMTPKPHRSLQYLMLLLPAARIPLSTVSDSFPSTCLGTLSMKYLLLFPTIFPAG
jgi:hypothetical protein